MLTWFSEKVQKLDSKIEGRGLFASADIPAFEVVVIKGGHIFDRKVRDQLAETLGPAEIQIDDHLFIGPMREAERCESMMYLNHSCNPNVGIDGQIIFRAMRNIPSGEELTFDYATGDDDTWSMECRCGSENCRRHITGQDWRKEEIQIRYKNWFSSYIRRKIEL